MQPAEKNRFNTLFLRTGAVVATLSATALLVACGGGNNAASSSTYPANTGVVATPGGAIGKQLWAAHCQTCHGYLASKAAVPNNVRNAINNNTGGMGSISLTQADLDNLAAFATNPIIY